MLLIILVAATGAVQPSDLPAASAVHQAKASVRIISGERVTADRLPEQALVRDTEVRAADGSLTTARLVEFP